MPSPSRRLIEAVAATAALALGTLAMGIDDGRARPEANPVAGPEIVPWLDTSRRDLVLDAYRAEFTTPDPELDWQGDHGRCWAGTSSRAHRQATIERVNFYRALAGVEATVVEEPSYSAKAQRAAMMMSVEGSLTHSPAPSFACFTTVGQEAAANSNLYLGRNGPVAIDGYIEDPGDRNVDVGHRTTILHPPTRRMGVGDVGSSDRAHSANALWVFDDRVFAAEGASGQRTVGIGGPGPGPDPSPPMREPDRFVAWPPRGYVPAAVVHPRWSFTMAGADFGRATVSVFEPSAPAGQRTVPVRIVNRSGAPGHVPLPTIVWEVEAGLPRSHRLDADRHFVVVVDGVETAGPTGAVGPSVHGYPVRVMGEEAGPVLTPAQFLTRLDRTTTP